MIQRFAYLPAMLVSVACIDIGSTQLASEYLDASTRVECRSGAVCVDDYASIQDALDAAADTAVPVVLCNPAVTYEITETLHVPAEVVLDGGGGNSSGAGATGVRFRAHIVAVAPLDVMIELGDFSGVRQLWIDGAHNASVGISAVNPAGIRIRPSITDNMIRRVGTGIKLGGAIYFRIKRNAFNSIADIGLDALAEYSGTYFGANVGVSEQNEYKGGRYQMRLEGILTSISDDFEGGVTVANIAIAGTHSTYFTLIDAYSEASGKFLLTETRSADIRMLGGYIDGNNEAGSVAFDLDMVPDSIHLSGVRATQFSRVFAGTIPTKAFVVDRSCDFSAYDSLGIRDMTLFAVGYRSLDLSLPEEGIVYHGTYRQWKDAAGFDVMASTYHKMTLASPGTIRPSDATAHLVRGHLFAIEFDGITTLDHGAIANRFSLISGADETPEKGTVKMFLTTAEGLAREVG